MHQSICHFCVYFKVNKMLISRVIASVVPATSVICMALFHDKRPFHDCFDIDVNPGLLFSEDDVGTVNEEPMLINKELPSECDSEKSNVLDEKKPLVLPRETQFYVLKFKSVFKCRICPRVICLTEDTLRVHLQSKVLYFRCWFNMLRHQIFLFVLL